MKTQEKFLSEMEELFGYDKYDFSKAAYTGARNPLEVVCKIHGSFYPMPTNLLKGRGCGKCGSITTGLKKRKNNDFFIKRASKVHGDKYDYSKVEYRGNNKDVEIICKEHGSFFQQPVSHYAGSGCTKCIKRVVKTLEDVLPFMDQRLVQHWEIVSEFNREDVNLRDPVEVRCKKHRKTFRTTFHGLTRRKSCCSVSMGEEISNSQKTDAKFYFEKIKVVHKDLYSYPNYPEGVVGIYEKLDIVCSKHGVFNQTIHHHVNRKQGCPECAKYIRGRSKTDSWIKRAIRKIKDELNSDDMCTLISSEGVSHSKDLFLFNCKVHGQFLKTYGNFVRGQRCPSCSIYEGYGKTFYIDFCKRHYNGLSNSYLIKLYNETEYFYKVGITVHDNLNNRFPSCDMPYNYEVVDIVKAQASDVVDFETMIHRQNQDYHYTPKIPFGGSVRECFTREGLESTISMFKDFKEFNNDTR